MKKLIALLLALVMVFALCACGPAGTTETNPPSNEPPASQPAEQPSDPPAGGKTALNVIISQYGNYTQQWWTQFEQDFEAANQDIDLTIEIVSWNDLYTVVETRIGNNNAPDILNIDTFADYVADDLLMPAEEYTSAELKAKIVPSFWNANEMDGTVWALPILASVRGLFYNKDILEAAGVANPPATWDEVKDACAKIKAYNADIIPWSLDISSDEGQAAFAYYTWNNGGGFVDDAGNWALNSEANIESLEFIKELYDAGYVYPDCGTARRYVQQDAFNAGSLAMMLGPCNMIAGDSTVNYGVAAMPTNGGNESVYFGVCDRLMAFKNDAAPDQAARTAAISKFFDFFYDQERYSDYMVFEGFLPVTSDASEYLPEHASEHKKPTEDGEVDGDNAYFDTWCATLANCDFYPASRAEWIDVKQGVIDAEQSVVLNGQDAKTVLDELQTKIVPLRSPT